MDALFRKYYWLVKLLGIGAIAGVALSAGLKFFGTPKLLEPADGVISFSKIKIDDAKKKKGGLGPVPNDPRSKMASAGEISSLNLFCPTCVPIPVDAAGAGASGGPVQPGEIKSRLPLMLLATMESDDPDYSMATIVNTQNNHLSAFAVNDLVQEGVTLTRVERGRVVFMNGQQAEYIEIGGTPPPMAPTAKVAPGVKPPEANGDGRDSAIQCRDENNCTVSRDYVNKLLANPAALTKEARVVPAIRNGETKGFKFYGIRPNSLPKLLGVKNGDMVTAVNGIELRGLDQAMGMYSKLRNASHLSISIERKGKPVQKEIDIK
jgi:general secretion pathway protein C